MQCEGFKVKLRVTILIIRKVHASLTSRLLKLRAAASLNAVASDEAATPQTANQTTMKCYEDNAATSTVRMRMLLRLWNWNLKRGS
ncbi:hypothetical protein SLA2020_434260 [Shorea laevis]